MFPSSGFFKGIVCPYLASGLCERPYCHYRHNGLRPTDDRRTITTGIGAGSDSILSSTAERFTPPTPIPTVDISAAAGVSHVQSHHMPSMLNMVGSATSRVQTRGSNEKSVLYRPTPKPTTSARATTLTVSAHCSKTGVPEYTPTPIRLLKQARSKVDDLEYDPISNYSTKMRPLDCVRVTLADAERDTLKRPIQKTGTTACLAKRPKFAEVVSLEVEAQFSEEEDENVEKKKTATDMTANAEPGNGQVSVSRSHENSPSVEKDGVVRMSSYSKQASDIRKKEDVEKDGGVKIASDSTQASDSLQIADFDICSKFEFDLADEEKQVPEVTSPKRETSVDEKQDEDSQTGMSDSSKRNGESKIKDGSNKDAKRDADSSKRRESESRERENGKSSSNHSRSKSTVKPETTNKENKIHSTTKLDKTSSSSSHHHRNHHNHHGSSERSVSKERSKNSKEEHGGERSRHSSDKHRKPTNKEHKSGKNHKEHSRPMVKHSDLSDSSKEQLKSSSPKIRHSSNSSSNHDKSATDSTRKEKGDKSDLKDPSIVQNQVKESAAKDVSLKDSSAIAQIEVKDSAVKHGSLKELDPKALPRSASEHTKHKGDHAERAAQRGSREEIEKQRRIDPKTSSLQDSTEGSRSRTDVRSDLSESSLNSSHGKNRMLSNTSLSSDKTKSKSLIVSKSNTSLMPGKHRTLSNTSLSSDKTKSNANPARSKHRTLSNSSSSSNKTKSTSSKAIKRTISQVELFGEDSDTELDLKEKPTFSKSASSDSRLHPSKRSRMSRDTDDSDGDVLSFDVITESLDESENASTSRFEECHRLFLEAERHEGNGVTSTRLTVMKEMKTVQGIEDHPPPPIGKKRVAHTSLGDNMEVKRILPEPRRAQPSAAKTMLNRYLELQKAAAANKLPSSPQDPVIPPSGVAPVLASGCAGTSSTAALKIKPRIAHVPKSGDFLKKPILTIIGSSKIPVNVRQSCLEKIYNECTNIYDEAQDAKDRASTEEKAIYEKSATKSIYLNLISNAVRRLRDESPFNKTLSPTKNPNAYSHEAILGGSKAMNTSYTVNRWGKLPPAPVTFSGSELYKRLSVYLMSESQLVENSFPQPNPNNADEVVIRRSERDLQKPQSSDPNQKFCCRCGKAFFILPNGNFVREEECIYHWGHAWKQRVGGTFDNIYNCCGGDLSSRGCQMSKCHVHDDNKYRSLSGYMTTIPSSPRNDGDFGVYAIDCEMVYTTFGCELARVTIIGPNLDLILDKIVKPDHEVIDYNTRFSGLTAEDLRNVTTSIRDIQAILLHMFNSRTILIGHSLESDLMALKLVHNTVVDTSIVFPHRRGLPFKRALQNVVKETLQKIIQNSISGHDSSEDARSCMELMLWKVKEDAKRSLRFA